MAEATERVTDIGPPHYEKFLPPMVKENYGKDKELKAITVMYKTAGYNPDAGDWYWAKYSPAGKADKYGKPAGCVGCHGTRAKNDFILVHEFE